MPEKKSTGPKKPPKVAPPRDDHEAKLKELKAEVATLKDALEAALTRERADAASYARLRGFVADHYGTGVLAVFDSQG